MARYRAKEDGFYRGNRIRKDAEFDLLDGHKPGSWMVKVDEAELLPVEKTDDEPATFSEANQRTKKTKVDKALAGE